MYEIKTYFPNPCSLKSVSQTDLAYKKDEGGLPRLTLLFATSFNMYNLTAYISVNMKAKFNQNELFDSVFCF
jgi:hypothetical protein